MNKVLFSSMSVHWPTPNEVYEDLDEEFGFDFDPCPLGSHFDGLRVDWGKSNFVNPPYGRKVGEWLAKGCQESEQGKRVVFLLPARTDTRWFHDYCMSAHEIRFIKGRLKFGGSAVNAPFPSMVVIFDKKCA